MSLFVLIVIQLHREKKEIALNMPGRIIDNVLKNHSDECNGIQYFYTFQYLIRMNNYKLTLS